MRKKTRLKLPFKRRRKGKTNYKTRLKLLLSGKPRLVIRRYLKHTKCQIVRYNSKGDETLIAVDTEDLKKFGWGGSFSNLPSAYLTGLLIGKMALKKKIREAIPDIGNRDNVKGSRINAVIKGAVEAGLNVPCSPDVLPDEKRVKGEHIISYFKSLDKDKLRMRFTKSNPIKQLESFDGVKKKILEVR